MDLAIAKACVLSDKSRHSRFGTMICNWKDLWLTLRESEVDVTGLNGPSRSSRDL